MRRAEVLPARDTPLLEPVGPEIERLVRKLEARFGEALAAVLLYGSCLHRGDLTDGVVDLYALVPSYGAAYRKRTLRIGNVILPPNVFYLEAGDREPRLRAKYAVLSLDDFEEGCRSWFHPYVWARFAQPARLVHVRDDATARRVRRAVAGAVERFLSETVPLMAKSESFDARHLWRRGLERTDASELRPERDRAEVLTGLHGEALERATAHAAPRVEGLVPLGGGRYGAEVTADERRAALRRWRLRRWQGKALSVLRLAKAAFTFEGGLEYAAWKVERHTGEPVPVTPALRKHSIVLGAGTLLHLVRQRLLR